jgi:hypothetical protein
MKSAIITTALTRDDETIAPGLVRISIQHEQGILQFLAFAGRIGSTRESTPEQVVDTVLSLVDDFHLDLVRDVVDADGVVSIDGQTIDNDHVRDVLAYSEQLAIAA